jgi:phospholipase C
VGELCFRVCLSSLFYVPIFIVQNLTFGVRESTLDLYPISDLGPQIFHTKTFDDFFSDAAAGALPSFSFLDENYETQSQESPQNVVVGEALMYDVVQAIGSSPNWDKTLLIINYDEHGGYYDHVTPPVALAPDDVAPSVPEGEYEYEGFTRYGFRVPAVVVSPWAKKDYISHLVYDHTSILALLEYKWNLPALTLRDANANNMLDFIDLDALASGTMNFPDLESLSLSLPGNATEALACSEDDPGVIPPVGSVS